MWGILVAISIPIFSGQLQKARIGTNQANLRSAKSAAVAEYLLATDTEKASTNGVGITLNVSTGTTTKISATTLTASPTGVGTDGDVAKCTEGTRTYTSVECMVKDDGKGAYVYTFKVNPAA